MECLGARDRARRAAQPFIARLDVAHARLEQSEHAHRALRQQARAGGPITKTRLRSQLAAATDAVATARTGYDHAAVQAEPCLQRLQRAEDALEAARREARIQRTTERLDALQRPSPPRHPQRGLGLDR